MRLERSVEARPKRRVRRWLWLVCLLLVMAGVSTILLVHSRMKKERMRWRAEREIGHYIRGYVRWLRHATEPESWCPKSLAELGGSQDVSHRDPWGRPYVMDCREGGGHLVIRSAGPDGVFETEDDVKDQVRLIPPGLLRSVGPAGDYPRPAPRGMEERRNPWR